MTVSSTTSRWEYTGDNATKIFAYTNKIFADADLAVYLDGVLKTLTTDYTVSGAGVPTGGNVTFGTAPGTGVKVLINRAVARTQGIDYVENDPFPAQTTEDGMDRAMIVAQEQDTALARRLGIAETDTFGTGGDLTIPVLATRTGNALGFDANGDPVAISAAGFATMPLPTTGAGLEMVRVNAGASGFELRTVAQTLADLSLEIGTDVQAFDAALDQISALAVTDGNIIVGNGTAWVAESGATARTSLGLAIGTDVQAFGTVLDDLNTLGAAAADGQVIVATGAGAFAYESGATLRTSLGIGTTDSPTFTGLTLSGAISTDTVSEKTAAAGVTVDGVLLKDNGLTASGTVDASGGDFEIKGQKVQSFIVGLRNLGGTIQHAIYVDVVGEGAANLSDKIAGASATWTATPVVDATTDFTTGVGLNAAGTQQVHLDVAAMTQGDLIATGHIVQNSTGTVLNAVRVETVSLNVNGVTRRRLYFSCYDAGNNAFNINATNIALNKRLAIQLLVFIP